MQWTGETGSVDAGEGRVWRVLGLWGGLGGALGGEDERLHALAPASFLGRIAILDGPCVITTSTLLWTVPCKISMSYKCSVLHKSIDSTTRPKIGSIKYARHSGTASSDHPASTSHASAMSQMGEDIHNSERATGHNVSPQQPHSLISTQGQQQTTGFIVCGRFPSEIPRPATVRHSTRPPCVSRGPSTRFVHAASREYP